MKKRLRFLLTVPLAGALLLSGCVPTANQAKATVQAGIKQTQTAAAPPTQEPAPLLPSPVPPPLVPPTAAPAVLNFGGSGRVLVQVSQCLPQGAPDCQDAPAGIYLTDLNGAAPKSLFEQARLLEVSPDGSRALIGQANPAGPEETLSLAGLNDGAKTLLSESFASPYACDSLHCGAVFLADGSILFIGTQKNDANNTLERTILKAAADGTAAAGFALGGPAVHPLYFYRSASPDAIYWETGSDQVPAGLVKAAPDGSAPVTLPEMIRPAFAPQGTSVAYLKQTGELGYDTALFVSTAPDQAGTQLFTPQTGESVEHAVWSPDGTALAFEVLSCTAECASKHYLWRADASALVELAPDLGETDAAPVWSPDGKFLFYIQAVSRSARAVSVESGQAQPFLDGLSLPEGMRLARLEILP